jgi:transposase
MKEEHKQTRKNARLATRAKRKSQVCKVYELKVDTSHLSKEKLSYFNRLFLEAKWFYNSILGSEDIFKYDTKINQVQILNKNKKLEERKLIHLSAQIKQEIKNKTISSIKAISTSKKKHKRSGRLKFKSKINSVPLRQFGQTYKFLNNNKYLKIQRFKKPFKILGFKQIPKEAEFANANLVRKASGYYLKVTCFLPKEEKTYKEKYVGIDFGIKKSLTLSNAETFDINFPVSKRTKKLQRQVKNKKLGSHNRYKHQNIINRQIERTTNQKKDKRNKIVSYITNTFETVIVQDENIKDWQSGWFGKKVQSSSIGGIMSDLKRKSHTLIMVDRYFPSTKLCPECGALNNISLSERTYICNCGYTQDRDIHSANNILREGLKQINREPINIIPVEEPLDSLRTSVLEKQALLKQEARFLRIG